MTSQDSITHNLHDTLEKIATAASAAGRESGEITLVAVSKYVGVESVRAAHRAGQRDFGENRIQDCAEKIHSLKSELPGARWHMIGHLQTNKVKKCVELFNTVQSVDSVRLAQELSRRCVEYERTMEILLQVNSSQEAQKSGLALEIAEAAAGEIISLPGITLRGLMTMGPLTDKEAEIRSSFRKTRQLFEKMSSQGLFVDSKSPQMGATGEPVLSMGMSGDFRIAIEEGSTMVRIGTAIFDPAG